MKVHAVSNPIKPNRINNVGFGRKLKEAEKPEYTKAIHDALDYLEVKNLSMIVHGSSFPSDKRDTSIGSPYSKGADKFVDFLKLNGFNAVQLGPGGSIGKKDNSPYISKVFAKNELFIDLEPLKTKKYADILSDKTYNEVTTQNKDTKDKNYNYTDFNKAFTNYDKALKEAYGNFKTKLEANDKAAVALNKEFEDFKKENKNWVENDGLYKVLSKENKSDKFEEWNETDKNLPQNLKAGDEKAKTRYDEIMKNHGEEIDENSFVQFIADKQLKESNQKRKSIGFNYIGDLLVGFNKSDVWANQGAFLKGWKLGCPYGGVNNGPQTWGIPVLDPKKMFKADGSLGESGKLLKEKVAYSLKNYDNVRIDHALGLVDPYVYKEDSVEKDANGAVRRDKLVGNNVSYMHEVDPQGNFKKVLSKIVLPTFKEYGVNKNDAVWEDLCSETQTFNEIYHGQEHLPGITQTEWRRAENSPKENWTLVGSHDSTPASEMVQKDWVKNSDSWNVDYLSGFLNPDPIKGQERAEYKDKIINSPQERVKAKFTELFRSSNNLQMMFVDFFGIDKVYNYGGQDKPTNWKLRVDNDFEDDYYRALQDKNSYALNMPEILSQAVKAKAEMEVAKNPNRANELRNDLTNKLSPLVSTLDKYSAILKEKEEIKPEKNIEVPVKKNNETAETKTKTSEKKSASTGSLVGVAVVAAVVIDIARKIKNKIKARKQEKVAMKNTENNP
ncbi:4-alpha-glucanotransferase [bacterium]|nr:4-alpha-glucanotransferase [bacterium]